MTWTRSLLYGVLLKLAACGAIACGPTLPACIAPTHPHCVFTSTDDSGRSCCRQIGPP